MITIESKPFEISGEPIHLAIHDVSENFFEIERWLNACVDALVRQGVTDDGRTISAARQR